jgi:hypothetical protein
VTEKAVSWWGSLHDGYLERFASSPHDRSATLAVRIDHLADDSGTGRGSHFDICLNVVRAVNITAWESWGPLPAGDQPGWNEALLQGRMISIEADDFAASGLRIVDATVYEAGKGSGLASGHIYGTRYATPAIDARGRWQRIARDWRPRHRSHLR